MKCEDLLHFYNTVIRPSLEYASVAWSTGITQHHSDMLESLQKRAFATIYPHQTYSEALDSTKSKRLAQRRKEINIKFWAKIKDPTDRCNHLITRKQTLQYNFRNQIKYELPRIRTERFKQSYIPYSLFNLQ